MNYSLFTPAVETRPMTEARLDLFNLSHTAVLNARRNSTPARSPSVASGP